MEVSNLPQMTTVKVKTFLKKHGVSKDFLAKIKLEVGLTGHDQPSKCDLSLDIDRVTIDIPAEEGFEP